ncbi:hypothetical protein GCM10010399_75550 [Dactylosporangium fulvum]
MRWKSRETPPPAGARSASATNATSDSELSGAADELIVDPSAAAVIVMTAAAVTRVRSGAGTVEASPIRDPTYAWVVWRPRR